MEWLTIAQAAQVMQMHQSTVYRRVQAIKHTKHVRKIGHKLQVSRAWADANSRESPRKTVRKQDVEPEMPTRVSTAPLEAESTQLMAELKNQVEWLRGRVEAAERRTDQILDQLRTLQDQNADLVALNTRLELGMAKPRHEAAVYVQEASQGFEEPEPTPELGPPAEEPRADLVAWLRAMKAGHA